MPRSFRTPPREAATRIVVSIFAISALAMAVVWFRSSGQVPTKLPVVRGGTYSVVSRVGGDDGPNVGIPLRSVKIATVTRKAIQVVSGAPFEIDLEAPGSLLLFSMASRSADGIHVALATFRIEAEDNGGWRSIFDANPATDLGWNDHWLDLSHSSPGARRLRFVATESDGDPANPAELYWSSIAIMQPSKSEDVAGDRPNVIVISLDTVSAQHLTSFAGRPGVSPHLDSLFEKSFLFTKAYAQYPSTMASHASMLSGLYPLHHGVYGRDPHLRVPTVATFLGREGYVTSAVTEDAYVAAALGFGDGFDSYDDGNPYVLGDAVRTFSAASSWLDTYGASVRFFLFVHTYEAHTPYEIRDDEVAREIDRLDPGYRGQFTRGYSPDQFEVAFNRGEITLPPSDLRHLAALYDGGISFLDRQLDGFMQHLVNAPFARNTIVIVTADHGEEFGEHAKLGHGETLFEPAIHVPLAIYWPGMVQSGTSDVPVRLVDLVPSILDLTGVATPAGLDGMSLVGIMRREPAREQRPPVYSEIKYLPFAGELEKQGRCIGLGLTEDCAINLRVVRTGRFKLMMSRQTGFEKLFDLDADPGETTDVREKFPDELARLRELLAAYDADNLPRGNPDVAAPAIRDKEIDEKLRGLGYLH